jgi:hypothetical protein
VLAACVQHSHDLRWRTAARTAAAARTLGRARPEILPRCVEAALLLKQHEEVVRGVPTRSRRRYASGSPDAPVTTSLPLRVSGSIAGRQSTARSSSTAPDDGADASVDVANGLLMVPLLPPAHTRAPWGKKGLRRSRKSDARRRAEWVFVGCPCASDPDVGLGRYIVGAERRVGGAGPAAVVCGCVRGGAADGGGGRRGS